MAGVLTAADGSDMEARWVTVALAVTAIGLAACGDDGDEPTRPQATKGVPRSGAPDLDRFLMRKGEEPGFRPGALPGAMPRTRQTIKGVEALVNELGLTQADEQRLRKEGFISSASGPIRGPRTAGITTVEVYETEEGAKHSQAHELRPDVIRAFGPVESLRYFTISGVPGARGWAASKPHVANVVWVQGRCMFVLGNQGPGRLAGPLSAGVRAIYERTTGECP
jgi:hypothetical protein